MDLRPCIGESPCRHSGAVMDVELIDRIERGFAAAVERHAVPTRLQVTSAQYQELARQYGVPEGLRMYGGGPVVIGPEFRWVIVYVCRRVSVQRGEWSPSGPASRRARSGATRTGTAACR